MCQTDEKYVRECLDGSPEAFRRLVQRYQQPLCRYLRGELGCEEAAIEASQETFVRAYFALRKLSKPESFFPWLLGIAHRVSQETHRANRRSRSIESLSCEPAEPSAEDPSADDRIREAVGLLPDGYRQIVLLRFYAGKACAEISRDLDMPLGTVTKRLSRAYAILRKSLREQDQAESVEAQL